MKRSFLTGVLCATALCVCVFLSFPNGFLRADNVNPEKTNAPEPVRQKWHVPLSSDLRSELVLWLDSFDVAPEMREKALEPWSQAETETRVPPEILSDRVVFSLRLGSEEVAAFLDASDALEWNELPFGQKLVLPEPPESLSLSPERFPRLLATLRMYLVLSLIRTHYYDEALELLKEMEPGNTIDPIAVLYSRGVAYNALMHKKEGLQAMRELRDHFSGTNSIAAPEAEPEEETPIETTEPENEPEAEGEHEQLPVSETKKREPADNAMEAWSDLPADSLLGQYSRRFAEVAKLVENELQNIDDKDEQPSNISRRMGDVSRRLGLGQTDEKVQGVEKGVLDSLDKLIEKLEEQQKKQSRNGPGGQGQPGDDSRIMRQKGPGKVDDKRIGSESGWGELPPKEREAALMQIEKEFPSHYREIIEQYFRSMADQER